MPRAFTIYWTPGGWKNLTLGTPITRAFGTGFVGKISAGDRVFVTNVKDGHLRLLGGFTVGRVGYVDDLPPGDVTWDAPEYLNAAAGQSTPLEVRAVSANHIASLRFLSSGKPTGTVAIEPDGSVNGQAMRATRELTPESAALIEGLLDRQVDVGWSEEELRASVEVYLDMKARRRRGERVVKSAYYRDLAKRFGRSESAFEYRLQNISYVMSLMGREWLQGLAPAKNVGVKNASTIERIIGELEGNVGGDNAAQHLSVASLRGRLKERPVGSNNPATTTTTATTFVRDPKVRAWVLDRANGICEACESAAPFTDTDDLPFLEVHHVRHLADGGKDTPENAVAVCPNCHRRLHFSRDSRDYRESLYERVECLIRD